MMGTTEVHERLASIAAAADSGDAKRAQREAVTLAAETLGALFSIATSLETIAACVKRPHPGAADQQAAFVATDVTPFGR